MQPNGLRSRIRSRKKLALVCAGGGITGAVYEIGCLRALEELLDRSVLDFDLYVGVSGGAFVASLLANGVTPHEMYESVVSRARRPLGVSSAPLFRLGLGELFRRGARAPRVLSDAIWTALTGEGRNMSDLALSLFELLPAGLLDTAGIQEYLAAIFRRRGRTDSFRQLQRELYIVAVDLDSGEAVPFGDRGRPTVPISRAVQASIAMPGLYRPVRIWGRDYVDGGVKKTAHINLAIRHGADMVVCLNPIVPIRADTALRGRMEYGLERYSQEHPEVDILLLQPSRDDTRMFSYNIMRYSARRVVAEHGYRSAIAAFARNARTWEPMLSRHGVQVKDATPPETPPALAYHSPLARTLASSLDRLDTKLRR